MSESLRQPRLSLRLSLGAVLAVALTAAWLVFSRDRSFERAEDRSHPFNDAERIVAEKVADQFYLSVPVRWGPHADAEEAKRMPTWYEGSPDVLVRVKVREARGTDLDTLYKTDFDLIYKVAGGRAVFVGFNAHGDDWKEKAKRGQVPDNPRIRTVQEILEGG
jgi:hypothetical protein